MADIKFEIIKKIGVLSTSASGWAKELNLISWNDRDPKYDLRDWSADHEKMGKGVTLSKEELLALKELLNSMEFFFKNSPYAERPDTCAVRQCGEVLVIQACFLPKPSGRCVTSVKNKR